ncbi:hypothetical protein [Caldalkalibacillus salinus]|uniref:hypothetical protein n=1 Tax=Caldalkalibacillus salinus TaxID=2803787 RepID=UPI001921DCBA|nr:hypothetical protein [Caldalkalibacillus salinus]
MGNLREQILATQDIKEEVVDIPEWETKVLVKGLNGAKRARLLQNNIDKQGNINFERMYPELLILTVHDPQSKEPVFQPEDRDALNAKNGGIIEKLVQTAMRLSGLESQAVENAVKN